MDGFRGFMSGLVATGGLALVGAVSAFMGHDVDLIWLLGTGFVEPGLLARGVGIALFVVLGGIIGMVYAGIFEDWSRSGPVIGTLVGLAHGAVLGLVLGWVADIHPQIPDVIADPGMFAAALGDGATTTLFAGHAFYGAIMGSLYRPRSQP